MPWWIWFLVGILLLGGEMLTAGGFYLLFFGLGAIAVGLVGLAGATWPLWAQWLAFTVLSIVATALFRRPLLAAIQRRTPRARVDDLSGEIATPRSAIAPGAVGRAELRGTVWSARNRGDRELAPGERCRVVRVDGLELLLEPETK
jgi:membrane protein implicated in regulation of membrane protease activity